MWRLGGVVIVGWMGCDVPMVGQAGVLDTAEVAPQEVDVPAAAEPEVTLEPCADAGLWRFPGTPQHIVVAADGDAIVAGTGDGGHVVRYDSERCVVVWDVTPSIVVRDMALVGDEVVLVGSRLVRLAAQSGAVVATDALAGAVVAGDLGLWVANGDLLEIADSTTVVRRDVQVTELVARGDEVFAAIGREVWRYTSAEGALLATFADEVVGLVLDESGDLFVTTSGEMMRVERVGGDPWSYALGPGLSGFAARAGSDFIVAGSASSTPVTDDFYFGQVGADDGYVARFAAHMAIMWTLEVIGGDGAQTVSGVGGDASGRQWVIGWAEREVVIGEDGLEGGGGFVARRPAGPGW